MLGTTVITSIVTGRMAHAAGTVCERIEMGCKKVM